MNKAKQEGVDVLTGSVNAPVVGGSGNTGSPAEPNPKSNELQNSAELQGLIEVAKQQAVQIRQLVEMNTESQRIIGKLGNEVGQLRKQQPAITPELKKQYKDMLDSEETALDAVNLVAGNTVRSVVAQDNAVLDAFFTARATDGALAGVGFDEYRWKAIKSGVPLENLGDADNAKAFLRQIVASRPIDVDAVRAASKAEGEKEAEIRFAALLKEKGVAGLVLPSSNTPSPDVQDALTKPLTDDEEQERMAILMAIGRRQITKDRIPEAKRLRYALN